MRDAFSSYHPAVNALWFALVLAVTVTSFHPLLLLTALVCALFWGFRLGTRWGVGVLLILFLTAALCNPLFTHAGATVLAYFPNGNPLTLESILFGLGAGLMLLAATALLRCACRVLTADKWMCLLGKSFPVLSLLLSMSLRALPRFSARLSQARLAQRQVGLSGHGILGRARQGVRLLSILTSWSLEEALTTADSMESRGYGLPGRTAYTNYTLDRRDRQLLVLLAAQGSYLFLMLLRGSLSWRYYPTVKWVPLDLWFLTAWLDWAVLCALPLILAWKEERTWNCINCKH